MTDRDVIEQLDKSDTNEPNGLQYNNVEIIEANFTDVKARNSSFKNVTIERGNFYRVDLSDSTFEDFEVKKGLLH